MDVFITAALGLLLTPHHPSIRPLTNARVTAPPTMVNLEWRVFGVDVPVLDTAVDGHADYNKVLNVSAVLHDAVCERLGVDAQKLPIDRIQLVRKSLDARPPRGRGRKSRITTEREVSWSHVVDVKLNHAEAKRIKAQPGRIVPAAKERIILKTTRLATPAEKPAKAADSASPPSVVVIGAGPCGLFAALTLARAGHKVTLCERGKPVEERGRSIGALVKRGILDGESNFCYGEGGAGTWSDGKLTTRIGRNSAQVRTVLQTLVRFGAPERILYDGKPHLGTDNLVRLLKRFREELISLGTMIQWDSRVEGLLVENDGAADGEDGCRRVVGVRLSNGEELRTDRVVLAAGHSARELYSELISCGATLTPKDFAVGFRIEHPQEVINEAQYGRELSEKHCHKGGRGPLPPASYRLATTVRSGGGGEEGHGQEEEDGRWRKEKAGGNGDRGVYSFCMCPGGQIVPTSLRPDHLCVNGMSYSNRGSRWANSAVVVSVGASYGDYPGLQQDASATESEAAGGDGDGGGAAAQPELAGLLFQEDMESRAAKMGGGDLKCPVQRVTDFLDGVDPSDDDPPLPPSSYRLGVKAAPLHTLYPPAITQALRDGIRSFASSMPGFDCDEALLHGVETRTSAPVQIARDGNTCEAVGLYNLFPAGEGAGYAGGIVSAAVDGLRVAEALLQVAEEDKGKGGRASGESEAER